MKSKIAELKLKITKLTNNNMKKSLLLLFFCLVIWAVKAQSIDVAAEFADATVVYVSYANGTDATGRGNFSAPYKTIRYALQQATGKTWIKVSSGTQTENATVDLKSNVLIEGGYTYNSTEDWPHSSSTTSITVNASASSDLTSNNVPVRAKIGFRSTSGITGWVLKDLNISVPAATTSERVTTSGSYAGSGATVYGIYIAGSNYSNPQSSIINCNIAPGAGGSGANGSAGSNGSNGSAGSSGNDGHSSGAFTRDGGNGGSGATGGSSYRNGGNGGNGGKSGQSDETNGSNGSNGSNGGGGATCTQRTNYGTSGKSSGSAGTYGNAGNNGAAGSAGSNTNVNYAWSSYFLPAAKGTDGGDGAGGAGGQGGGGGGGRGGSLGALQY
ncbi:MAG: hypothetical protein MJ053_07515, partial [Elusimicrobiaceae bacterium]|nr:hypothetical protein [Elusimicrobiaceae bacterium]